MLRLFAASTGQVLSKQQLLEGIRPNVHVGEDSLFQCIREIRSALGDDKREMIRVISGRGYLFEAEVIDTAAVRAARQGFTAGAPAHAEPDIRAAAETNAESARPFGFDGMGLAD